MPPPLEARKWGVANSDPFAYSILNVSTRTLKKSRIMTVTKVKGRIVWKRVITAPFTDVSAVVAKAVRTPGMSRAAKYPAMTRKMISMMIMRPLDIALDSAEPLRFVETPFAAATPAYCQNAKAARMTAIR